MAAAATELAAHLESPAGRGHTPARALTGAAGGATCGDLVRVSLAVNEDGAIHDAGFDASGCATVIAAGSATVSLVTGTDLLAAARVGPREIAAELGGLGAAGAHAAELAADALHRALGSAARGRVGLTATPGRTLVAMSGGVDSATAALLAAREGEAVGVTLELWSDAENDGAQSCCSAQSVRAARTLAHELGMPHLSIDLREEFRAGVVEEWLSDHAAGLTPNPCVRCNGSVRLDAMLELASRLGAATLATGHYARVTDGPLLRVAADGAKDQSYVLCALSPASLSRLRFPLGEMEKPAVRDLAEHHGIPVARRPDSQDLCFLAGTGRERFLERHGGLGARDGDLVDETGRRIGTHTGAHRFTVGQRRGLGVSAPEPYFVLATDAVSNTVTVGPRAALLAHRFPLRDVTLHAHGREVDGVRVRAHGRMRSAALSEALPVGRHARAQLTLAEPAERTAPGQIACLYRGDVVVGHATIAAR
ncbi:MAG TPA: tRNA 2-thiouridine(34) synthase MnmA [Solirubrobacteraceae bacterium]|nr:tRNA 2-thiouridine(34) synthase MnmA [Solirubrobacteraceae bacterium]